MNQKPTSMPIFSLSMSVSSGVRQLLNDESHRLSADARDANEGTVAAMRQMMRKRIRCEYVNTSRRVGESGATYAFRTYVQVHARSRAVARHASRAGRKELAEGRSYATEEFAGIDPAAVCD